MPRNNNRRTRARTFRQVARSYIPGNIFRTVVTPNSIVHTPYSIQSLRAYRAYRRRYIQGPLRQQLRSGNTIRQSQFGPTRNIPGLPNEVIDLIYRYLLR